ncbi:hypothetical protein MHYP_G00179540 [Metynnis hypsauchen]
MIHCVLCTQAPPWLNESVATVEELLHRRSLRDAGAATRADKADPHSPVLESHSVLFLVRYRVRVCVCIYGCLRGRSSSAVCNQQPWTVQWENLNVTSMPKIGRGGNTCIKRTAILRNLGRVAEPGLAAPSKKSLKR